MVKESKAGSLIQQNIELKQKTLKQEKILEQLNKEYEQIKNR